ncbi:bacteriocin immunity protein [Actinophytocola gossypii]|uniref:Bacteriocin immunity protein n=1 Tax=Actinophytocola gossypii TaxID=2812003 RepID=A0ABT2JA44_9PSEU|nr:bacteriocin immunity protein [Actinophytocola gossypii]MCT2584656.1 bacteriocin immunity protein [Actinophytocola gossypii]
MTVDREHLVGLAAKLIAGEYQSDVDLDNDMSEFSASVPHPRASDLIYYWQEEFDHEPTPEEVVDRALAYKPIDL